MRPLNPTFFLRDPVEVARELLGCALVHNHPERGQLIGRIVETEAYRGEEDLACHASSGLTPRNAPMYGPPGRAYIYLIYGMYNMFNAVTSPEGQPAAVLVRALEPIAGIQGNCDGPGKLTRAMGIDRTLNHEDLTGARIQIVSDPSYHEKEVCAAPRIGVDYAGSWAERPWRFLLEDNPWISRPPPGGVRAKKPRQ